MCKDPVGWKSKDRVVGGHEARWETLDLMRKNTGNHCSP